MSKRYVFSLCLKRSEVFVALTDYGKLLDQRRRKLSLQTSVETCDQLSPKQKCFSCVLWIVHSWCPVPS